MAIDVGDGVGALVLYAGAERAGLEVEIHPIGQPELRRHVWVLEREVGSATVFAAVFGSLDEGRYGICAVKGGEAVSEVAIAGGTVTEARWA